MNPPVLLTVLERRSRLRAEAKSLAHKALLVWLMASSGFGQQVGTNQQASGPSTFQSSTQLVVETVLAKDKAGKPIEGLTQKDFTVTEDGVPQTIRFFEYQKLPEASEPEPAYT